MHTSFYVSLCFFSSSALHTFFCPPYYTRGGGLGSRPIFKKFHETYAPS